MHPNVHRMRLAMPLRTVMHLEVPFMPLLSTCSVISNLLPAGT